MKNESNIALINQTLYGYSYDELTNAKYKAMERTATLELEINNELNDTRILDLENEAEFCNTLYNVLYELEDTIGDINSSQISTENLPDGWYWIHSQGIEQNDTFGELISPKGNSLIYYNAGSNQLNYNGVSENYMNLDFLTREDFQDMANSFIEKNNLIDKERLNPSEIELNNKLNQWIEPPAYLSKESILIPKLTEKLINNLEDDAYLRKYLPGYGDLEASIVNESSNDIERLEIEQEEEMELL